MDIAPGRPSSRAARAGRSGGSRRPSSARWAAPSRVERPPPRPAPPDGTPPRCGHPSGAAPGPAPRAASASGRSRTATARSAACRQHTSPRRSAASVSAEPPGQRQRDLGALGGGARRQPQRSPDLVPGVHPASTRTPSSPRPPPPAPPAARRPPSPAPAPSPRSGPPAPPRPSACRVPAAQHRHRSPAHQDIAPSAPRRRPPPSGPASVSGPRGSRLQHVVERSRSSGPSTVVGDIGQVVPQAGGLVAQGPAPSLRTGSGGSTGSGASARSGGHQAGSASAVAPADPADPAGSIATPTTPSNQLERMFECYRTSPFHHQPRHAAVDGAGDPAQPNRRMVSGSTESRTAAPRVIPMATPSDHEMRYDGGRCAGSPAGRV